MSCRPLLIKNNFKNMLIQPTIFTFPDKNIERCRPRDQNVAFCNFIFTWKVLIEEIFFA